MHCPKCQLEQPDINTQCVGCGLIFAKYEQYANRFAQNSDNRSRGRQNVLDKTEGAEHNYSFGNLFLLVPDKVDGIAFASKAVLLAIVFFLTWQLFGLSINLFPFHFGFLHGINLIFHEAGHWIFIPFGEFLHILGGTLGQLLIPFICFFTFWLKEREMFSAAVMLWWLGENFMDIAPYINDARDRTLVLLGGQTGQETVSHDWENILIKLDALRYDHSLAQISFSIGKGLMIVALVWAGIMVYRHFMVWQKTKTIRAS